MYQSITLRPHVYNSLLEEIAQNISLPKIESSLSKFYKNRDIADDQIVDLSMVLAVYRDVQPSEAVMLAQNYLNATKTVELDKRIEKLQHGVIPRNRGPIRGELEIDEHSLSKLKQDKEKIGYTDESSLLQKLKHPTETLSEIVGLYENNPQDKIEIKYLETELKSTISKIVAESKKGQNEEQSLSQGARDPMGNQFNIHNAVFNMGGMPGMNESMPQETSSPMLASTKAINLKSEEEFREDHLGALFSIFEDNYDSADASILQSIARKDPVAAVTKSIEELGKDNRYFHK